MCKYYTYAHSLKYLQKNCFASCSRISENLHEYLPSLDNLILTGNNIQELGDLEPLTHLPKLETLCLLMNPVSTKSNYREYMAFK